MLIRVSSGASGIVEYLEKGQKKDRWFDRDELDQRVVLDGDINQLDNVINSINDESPDKYFHYTLSFKEQHINNDVLNEVAIEFKQFIKAAYIDDELEFYAEAHLPKIKSYTDANGEIISRFPHIHVVVPKVNLLDGNKYNPLIKREIKYMDSFQEYINNKYNLESPKDNLREKLTSTSEIISRYKYDVFIGKNIDVKNQILDTVLNKNIISQRDLYLELEKQGYTVKIRNPTKPEQSYINITPPNETKGINLKESVFRPEFLQLTSDQKLQKLNTETGKTYSESSTNSSKELSNKHQHNLHQWYQFKALETRYIPESNAKDRAKYTKLTHEEKLTFLHNKHDQTINNYLDTTGVKNNERIEPISKSERDQLARKLNRDLERVQQNLNRIGITNPATRERIRELAAGSNRRKHRPDLELTKTTKQSRTATEQLKNDTIKSNIIDKHEVRITELNSQIKATVLLELAQKTHGINPDIYSISSDANGADRIKCGSRNLNVIDFTTKELNLPFKEAIPYLKNVLNAQHDITRDVEIKTNQRYLNNEYQKWFEDFKASKNINLNKLSAEYKTKRTEILKAIKDNQQNVRTNNSLSPTQKQYELLILKSQKILELNALDKANKQTRDAILKKQNTDMRKSYQVFLMEKAKQNDDKALAELRRLKVKYEPPTNSIRGLNDYQEFKLNVKYDINENGTISYKVNNKIIIEDEGKRINVKQGTEDNIKLSLELSMAKFGNKITLDGDELFRKSVVETAIKNNMKVQFEDSFSKKYYQKVMSKLQESTKAVHTHNQEAISKITGRCQYLKTEAINVLDKDKVKSVNLHHIKDLQTGNTAILQSKYLDYLQKNNELNPATFFDSKIDNEITLKRTKSTIIKKEIKDEIIKASLNEFNRLTNQKHQITKPEVEYTGKFIKLDKTRYGKEYATIRTLNGYTKLYQPEVINSLKKLNLTSGDTVNIKQVKTVNQTKTRPTKKTTYTNLNKSIDYELLQLMADLKCKTSKQKIRKECLGEVVEVKKSKNSTTPLYRAVMRDQDNKLQVLFLNNNENIKAGDFTYIRQNYKSHELVNLTAEHKEMVTKSIDKHSPDTTLEQATLSKYGYREIRGKDIFFAEFKITNDDGSISNHTQHGDRLKDELMTKNITAGANVLIINSIENENVIEQHQVIESVHLDKDIEVKIEEKYNELVTQKEVDYEQEDNRSTEIELD